MGSPGEMWVLCLAIASLGCASLGDRPAASVWEPDAERDAAVMSVLDRYMDGLNALDLETHVSTYHFPHYRHASGKVILWQDSLEAMPILGVPKAERLPALRAALESDWVRSEWTRRDIVQADAHKVHVVTRFDRLRADGSVIKSFDSLYVLTLAEDDAGALRWGIKGRSSFAP